jgi:hypothetical protein
LSASKFWEKRHIWMQINEKGFYERAFNVTFGRNRKLRLPELSWTGACPARH